MKEKIINHLVQACDSLREPEREAFGAYLWMIFNDAEKSILREASLVPEASAREDRLKHLAALGIK